MYRVDHPSSGTPTTPFMNADNKKNDDDFDDDSWDWGEEPDWVKKLNASTDENDDEEEDEDGEELAPAQHLVVLVDCAPSMFQALLASTTNAVDMKADQATTAMDWSLEAFKELYREVIKTTVTHKVGKRNGLGAILYNTRQRSPLVFQDSTVEAVSPTKKEHDADHDYYAVDEEDEEHDDDHVGLPQQTIHELIPLEIPNTPSFKRILGTLPDPLTHERVLDIHAEYGHDNSKDDYRTTYESHLQLPIYRAIDEAKRVLDSAKCVRNKPTKVKGNLIMPPDAKQIWILTNQDNDPCHGNAEMHAKVQERIAELKQAGVKVYVWQLPTKDMVVAATSSDGDDRMDEDEADEDEEDRWPQCELVPNDFFSDVGMIRPLESDEVPLDLEMFTRLAFRLNFKLRPSYSVPLLLPDWKENPDYPGIQIDLYKIVKRATKPTALRFHNEDGTLMTRITTIKTANTLSTVSESISGLDKKDGAKYKQHVKNEEIRLYASLRGGKEDPLEVEMHPNDLVEMKEASNANPDFASLILIGFKPRDQFRVFDTIGEPYFMYPQDTKVEGSGRAFAQLYRGMKRKGVLAVAELLTRKSASSRCVAFWPIENDGSLELPPQEGMVMVDLPFQDELRTLPKEKDYAVRMMTNRDIASLAGDGPDLVSSNEFVLSASLPSFVSNELIEGMSKLVEKQTLVDRQLGIDFENAYLSEFYKYLESQSLGTKWQPSNDYDTILTEERERAILDVAGKEIEAVKYLLPDDIAKAAGKRKSTATTNIGADDTGIDWDEEYDAELIGKITVPNLKKYCQAHGLKVGGNKADLVERVTDDISERRASSKAVKPETVTS